MCTCDHNNPITEEYYTPLADFEIPSQDWRTSTRYERSKDTPEYIPLTPRRIPRRDFRRAATRDVSARDIPRRPDLITGVAIVPRRIDFDGVSDVEDLDDEEDLGFITTETLQRLREAAQRPVPGTTAVPGTYKPRRFRQMQYPPSVAKQYAPRMTRMTPCGECLRI